MKRRRQSSYLLPDPVLADRVLKVDAVVKVAAPEDIIVVADGASLSKVNSLADLLIIYMVENEIRYHLL